MYQIHLRAQASKLAALTARWPFIRIQHYAADEPSRGRSHLRAAFAALASLATSRVLPGSVVDTTERHDPHDPRNW